VAVCGCSTGCQCCLWTQLRLTPGLCSCTLFNLIAKCSEHCDTHVRTCPVQLTTAGCAVRPQDALCLGASNIVLMIVPMFHANRCAKA
jgi:hypothetical protein